MTSSSFSNNSEEISFSETRIEDLEALAAIENRIDLEDVRNSLADAKKNGTVSWEVIKRKLDL